MWAWPDWSQAALDGICGGRWDHSQGEYRVLYTSSTRFGAAGDGNRVADGVGACAIWDSLLSGTHGVDRGGAGGPRTARGVPACSPWRIAQEAKHECRACVTPGTPD